MPVLATDLHFDVLIALTARRIGAYLITCNLDVLTPFVNFWFQSYLLVANLS